MLVQAKEVNPDRKSGMESRRQTSSYGWILATPAADEVLGL